MTLLLNTLYLTLPESALHKDGETVVVKVAREKRLQVPLHHLAAIVVMAEAWMSPDLMRTCLERDISVTFLNERGRFLGRLEGTGAPGAMLRKNQMEAHLDPTRALALAKVFTQGKLANQRHVLQRACRESEGDTRDELAEAAKRIALIQPAVDRMETLDQVRGCEGEGAARYFENFGAMVRQQGEAFPWKGRNRRPPLDPLNALLSFAYALLMSDCLSACQSVGLDPAFGFLHAFRVGRPSLALDLMEAFRPLVADRLVLTLVNNQQLRPSDFTRTESGAVILSDEARKLVITTHQQRKAQTLRHPFLEQEIPWGLAPLLEARLLARHLRGDLESFPPFHPRG
jgi:CRISPR-associated protein Cas1